jgi:hypothetical protein
VRLVLRIFRQVLSASLGKRTLVSVAAAIIPLAVIVVLVAISFRDEPGEDELIGAIPAWPPAGPPELQSVRPSAALIIAPPSGDAETAVQSSGASRELVPSPRPRRVHNTRNVPDNVLPMFFAGPSDVQPVRPSAALMVAPPAGEAETAVQSSGASREPAVIPTSPGGPTEVQPVYSLAASTATPPAGEAETAVQSSGESRELVPSPRARPVYKARPRRVHKMRNAPNSISAFDARFGRW